MNFYLDELSLATEFASVPIGLEKIRNAVDAMHRIVNTPGCTLFIAPNIYELDIDGENFSQLIFTEDWVDRRDETVAFQLAIDRAVERGQTKVGNGVSELRDEGRGGLVTQRDCSGENWWSVEAMFKVADATSFMTSLRGLFIAYQIEEESLKEFAGKMFPQAYFHVFPTCRKLSIDHQTGIARIIKHLAWLNDEAAIAFETRFHEVINLAGSRGLNISPESPNTHSDAEAMKQRQICIAGKTLTCEWHMKFEPTHGRLHFYAFRNRPQEIRDLTANKVIVGIAVDHLK